MSAVTEGVEIGLAHAGPFARLQAGHETAHLEHGAAPARWETCPIEPCRVAGELVEALRNLADQLEGTDQGLAAAGVEIWLAGPERIEVTS